MSKDKGPNIFNYLNQIFYKNNKLEYDKKMAPAYMLSMWLSHDPKLIDIVENINHLQFLLKDDIIYKYYMDKVPKGKRFIRWTNKSPQDKKRDKRVKELMVEEKLSKREAIMTIGMKERINQ